MKSENYPGELDQGKRIIKRLKKSGVAENAQYEFLFGALQQAVVRVTMIQARQAGRTTSVAMMMATEARSRVAQAEPGPILGRRLYDLMVANGSTPGRVKRDVDGLLDMLFKDILPAATEDEGWVSRAKSNFQKIRVYDVGDDHLPGGRETKVKFVE